MGFIFCQTAKETPQKGVSHPGKSCLPFLAESGKVTNSISTELKMLTLLMMKSVKVEKYTTEDVF